MTITDLTALAPLIVMSGTAIVLMMAIAIRRSHVAAATILFGGLLASLAGVWIASPVAPRQVTGLLIVDTYSLFYMAILICASAFVTAFAFHYLEVRREHREEFYLLLALATTGAMVLVASRHFVSFFLGLEILSVSLYALVAYMRTEETAVEAGMKYLVLAAFSSSALLFGLALIYAQSGSLELSQSALWLKSSTSNPLLIASFVLVLTGIGFKLAVVPFHAWTPDVYEGAPLPVTASIATVSKAGVLALVLRWFGSQPSGLTGATGVVLTVIAIASMFGGNLLALQQNNLKRIVAYSSIAHMGYMLVALLAGGSLSLSAATYYLIAYIATLLGLLGIMTVVSGSDFEATNIESCRGLFWRRPLLAATFTTMLLSLAGIPLTAGFLGKFYILASGATQQRWLLLFSLIISNTIGLFYYLRIIVAMYGEPDSAQITIREDTHIPVPAAVALLVLTGLVFFLGVYPAPLWDAIQKAAGSIAPA